MHFIIGLLEPEEAYDGILIVVDRATNIVHLIAVI